MQLHSKAITGISCFPTGHLFLTCSSDKTICMIDLKIFQEIYRQAYDNNMNYRSKLINKLSRYRILGEMPLSIHTLMERQFFVHYRDRIDFWTTTHQHSSFTSLS
jgi:WD40 repeat protein